MHEAKSRPSEETLKLEQRHLRARQRFEAAANNLDQVTGIEGTWQHLDNWLYKPAAGSRVDYTYDPEAKKKATSKLAASHRALQKAFAALPEGMQRSLVERPVIEFRCRNGQGRETGPSSFEFNLPEIVAGFEARCRLDEEYTHSWRQAVRTGEIEMAAGEYGYLCWQSQALFHDSVNAAGAFAVAGVRRFYGGNPDLNSSKQQPALERIDDMERLSKIYLDALGNGDKQTQLALHHWLSLVNGIILNTCESDRAATRVFGLEVSWGRVHAYPHEADLIPVGRTMVRGKNARATERHHYIADR
ncbi:hypothetical protein F4X86_02905 [Candidatus Saccharibacteria bacterium]|nr:hypothetical protein [Candidatus Saccharibacteria bacterium]